jgi:hypothetical protein
MNPRALIEIDSHTSVSGCIEGLEKASHLLSIGNLNTTGNLISGQRYYVKIIGINQRHRLPSN